MGTPSFLIKNTTSFAALHSEESGAFRAMGLDIGCAPVFRNRQPTRRFAGTPGRLPFLLAEADFLPAWSGFVPWRAKSLVTGLAKR